jgi:uncharacterized membrane protein
MDWILFAVQWLHVLLGIFWFGSTLFSDFILIPAISTLPLPTQRVIGAALAPRSNRIIPAVAGAVILLGIIRGTVLGPVQSLEALGSAYGITWVVSLLVAVGTFLWTTRVIAPSLDRLASIPEVEAINPDGTATTKLTELISAVKRNVAVELLGFFVIFTCMILMRFGL